jgi:hypothetical protein
MAAIALTVALFAAPAGASPAAPNILLLETDRPGTPDALINALEAHPGVNVDDWNPNASGTPSLATLQSYDLVISFSNDWYSDPNAIGNLLADYVDGGGILESWMFNNQNYPGEYPTGRWDAEGYSPFQLAGQYGGNAALGTFDAASPLMQNVSVPDGYYYQFPDTQLSSGATLVASWNNSAPFVATKGNVIGVNAYPGQQSSLPEGFVTLMLNGVGYVDGPVCTITGTLGVDRIRGTSGDDVICGLDGDDVLDGRGGDDILIGGDGIDTLIGKSGNDTLQGGVGNDLLLPGAGNDTVDGGDGLRDRALFTDIQGGGIDVSLASGSVTGEAGSNVGNDQLSNIEQVFGSSFDDILVAGLAGVSSTLKGGLGDDHIDTSDGDGLDAAVGNQGDDICTTDAGDRNAC